MAFWGEKNTSSPPNPLHFFEPRKSNAGMEAITVSNRALISILPTFTWDDKSNWQGLCHLLCWQANWKSDILSHKSFLFSPTYLSLYLTLNSNGNSSSNESCITEKEFQKNFFYSQKSIPQHVSCDCMYAQAPFTALVFIGLWRNISKPQQAH